MNSNYNLFQTLVIILKALPSSSDCISYEKGKRGRPALKIPPHLLLMQEEWPAKFSRDIQCKKQDFVVTDPLSGMCTQRYGFVKASLFF